MSRGEFGYLEREVEYEQAVAEVSCSNAWEEAQRHLQEQGFGLNDLPTTEGGLRALFRVGFMMGALFGSERVGKRSR